MERAQLRGLPRRINGHGVMPRWSSPLLSVAVELRREAGSHHLASQITSSVLGSTPASVVLVKALSDTARIAAQYVAGRSAAPRYWLLISADDGGVTVAASDYAEPELAGPPAWLPVSGDTETGGERDWQLSDAEPGAGDPLGNGAASTLTLSRTPDGHVRLGSRMPW